MTSKQKRINAATWFATLGHHRRILVRDLLKEAGKSGIRFENLCLLSRMSPSTLSHHLMLMDRAEILKRQQKGRESWISLNYPNLNNFPA